MDKVDTLNKAMRIIKEYQVILKKKDIILGNISKNFKWVEKNIPVENRATEYRILYAVKDAIEEIFRTKEELKKRELDRTPFIRKGLQEIINEAGQELIEARAFSSLFKIKKIAEKLLKLTI